MKEKLSGTGPFWNTWIFVPLRLFLGVTFLYAGLQKLTDPQYANPSARGYIGHQISAFANGSPLHNWLVTVAVPHALLFGVLVEFGEPPAGMRLGTQFFGLLEELQDLFRRPIDLLEESAIENSRLLRTAQAEAVTLYAA